MTNFAEHLNKSDEDLLDSIFETLKAKMPPEISPYGQDDSFAREIRKYPLGLRAMAATHWLDLSLTLDDLPWHFLNFGEEEFTLETASGLRELGLGRLAELFEETKILVLPIIELADSNERYYELLEASGHEPRFDEMNKEAWDWMAEGKKRWANGPIYAAWIQYARAHPERVFGNLEREAWSEDLNRPRRVRCVSKGGGPRSGSAN